MTRFQPLALATLVCGYLLIVVAGVMHLPRFSVGIDSAALNLPSGFHYLSPFLGGLVILGTLLMIAAAWRQSSTILRRLSGLVVLLAAGSALLSWAGDDSAWATALHLGLAELFLALLIVACLVAYRPRLLPEIKQAASHWSSAGYLAIAAGASTLGLMLTGGYYAKLDAAGPHCDGWPLCNGHWLPTGFAPIDIQLIHRAFALITFIMVIALAIQARRVRRDSAALTGLATSATVLMLAAILVGACTIWFKLSPVVGPAHLAVATIFWGVLVSIVALDRLIPVGAGRHTTAPSARALIHDYFILTKPGVMLLLLVTTLGAMLLAQRGLPPLRIIVWTLIGGALASGGAAALKHFYDRDIDEIMARTRRRPVPLGHLTPVQAVIFGLTLSALSVYFLAVFVNPLAALLALCGNIFYVVIYTMWLKRATPQNIVIGGAAGAIPPLVGWAAVTGHVGVPALVLFGIIFCWTPPHFWGLCLFRAKTRNYAEAGVPMYPGVYGDAETRKQILLYTLLTVCMSLFLYPLGVNGPLYFLAALALGGFFIYRVIRLMRHPDSQPILARGVFMYSNYYLLLLFAFMVGDHLIGWF